MTELQSSDFSSVGEGEDEEHLTFLRNEGLEILALFKAIRSDPTRRVLRDLMRTIVAGQWEAASDGDGRAE